MGEVPSPQELDTLPPGPQGKGLHLHLRAGRPAVPGMEVKIGDEFHRASLLRKITPDLLFFGFVPKVRDQSVTTINV